MAILSRIIGLVIGKPGTHPVRRLLNAIAFVVLLPWMLLIVFTCSGMIVNNASRNREAAAQRARHKIRVGDTPENVKLRLGEPTSTARNESTHVTAWGYASADSGTNWIMLADGPEGPRVSLVELAPARPPLWTPEDGLAPMRWDPARQARLTFERALGAACETVQGDEPGMSALYFPLSVFELHDDPAYDAMVGRPWPQDRIVRYLSVAEGKDQRVLGSGWKTITPVSPCYNDAARNRK